MDVRVPQIWMTYEELGRLMLCDPDTAREMARRHQLDRKKSRDGRTRAKLNFELIGLFIAQIRAQDGDLDRSIAELRHVHDAMTPATPRIGAGSLRIGSEISPPVDRAARGSAR